jgi:hypothetical protein
VQVLLPEVAVLLCYRLDRAADKTAEIRRLDFGARRPAMSKTLSVTAMLTAGLAAVFSAVVAFSTSWAWAGDVRHQTIPKEAWGTWALKPDLCTADEKSNIVIKEGGGSGPNENCAVEYVVETAGANGPIYSAHMWCTDKSDAAKKSDMTFLVIPRGDVMRVGTNFDDLKTYNRCPATN